MNVPIAALANGNVVSSGLLTSSFVKTDGAVERPLTAPLDALVVVVAGLRRVRAHQPRDADIDVTGIGVEDEVAERTDVVRRRVRDAAGPSERRRHLHAVPSQIVVPDREMTSYDNVAGSMRRRVREDVRKPHRSPRCCGWRSSIHRQRIAAEVRSVAGHRTALLMVVVRSPGELGERRGVDRPVQVRGGHPDAVVVLARVVPARENALNRIVRLLILEELEAAAQIAERLVVDADDRLIADQIGRRIGRLVVVGLTRRNVRRYSAADTNSGWPSRAVQRALRILPSDAAVSEAGDLAGRVAHARLARIPDVRVGLAQVVRRLRKITLALEQRGHPVSGHIAAERARLHFLRVEEEQFVGAAGFADRPPIEKPQSRSSWIGFGSPLRTLVCEFAFHFELRSTS